jgi:hypothetical protein
VEEDLTLVRWYECIFSLVKNQTKTSTDLDRLGQTWTDLDRLEQTWTDLGRLGQTWKDLDRHGQTWTNLDRLGQTWTFRVQTTTCVLAVLAGMD